ncbi:MAG: L,D-transpeptidase [Gaiellaceae bacterium]
MRMLLFACALAVAGIASTAAPAQDSIRPSEPFLAATPKGGGVVLRDRPGGHALATLGDRTEFGSPETVGVAETRGSWLAVISTQLPNGVVGWVPRKAMSLRPVTWSLDISLSRRLLVVRHDGQVVRRVTVGIGAADSPTPAGRYVITDHIDPGAQSGTYGCCILALSGHQPHPPAGWSPKRDWRLAIHGGATGAISAGCVHADEATLRLLMRQTPLGTPVTVSR